MASRPLLETEVLVVGSGPAGASAAALLATYGVDTMMVSKHGSVANTPRAHITNQRTMEIMRDLGIESEIRALGTSQSLIGENVYCTSLVGDEIARLRAWGTETSRLSDYASASPCSPIDLPQPYLEPVLVRTAQDRGASVRLNTEFLSLEQDSDGVTARLRDRLRGDEYLVHSRYVIGADGAGSRVARQIGLRFDGREATAGSINIVFSADLTRYVEHRPGVLYWVLRPGEGVGTVGMGVIRMVRPWNRWMAVWGYDINGPRPELDDAAAEKIVHDLLGDSDIDVTIEGSSVWAVNESYASRYSDGRVFCVGDAVHRHSPANGLGSNTSVQDSYNLAWKLASVLRDHASPSLLETYNTERVPVGRQVVERASRSASDFQELFGALGLGDGTTRARLEDGLAALSSPDRAGAERRRALGEAIRLKHYEYSAHGVEMNQRYDSTALVRADHPEVWLRDRELYHQAALRPGAKLPHVWLTDRSGRRVSTLDVVGAGEFTLLTGLSGLAWEEAVRRRQDRSAVPLRVVRIGTALSDGYGDWGRISQEVPEAGCVLVRPDGYIAWVSHTSTFDAASGTRMLEDVLTTVLRADDVVARQGSC